MAYYAGGGHYRGNNNSQNRNRSYNRSRSRFSRKKFSRPKTIDTRLYVNDFQSEVKEDARAYEGKLYTDYHFDDKINRNLKLKDYTRTTEIQEKTIPYIMNGKNVVGISATGSGKTGAFLIPMIQKLLDNNTQKLLVVAPTRELALQIKTEAASFLRGTHLQVALIIGGESMYRQISQLRKGGHIVVGTPGRLNDLIKRGNIKPIEFNNIVVDEVDRMLDMGFINDIKFIFSKINPVHQTLLFSATLGRKIETIVNSLISSYEMVKLSNNTPTKSVVQSIVDYNTSDQKIDLLTEILNRKEVKKAIVFVDTKRYADKVDKLLYQQHFRVKVLHGDKRQNVRKRVIQMFKDSKINVLVATNVAARGIDIDDITHVINLDEPQTYDEYIHRIGRTGRNGSLGTAYTFVGRNR